MNDDIRGIRTAGLKLWYGAFQALIDVDLHIRYGLVTGLIGPSGCGKTTLLRCFNRINERIAGVRTEGRIEILGEDVYASHVDLVELRRRVGMVFQRPNPLPLSVRENVLFGLRVHGGQGGSSRAGRAELDNAVENALREVGLWDALRDRLHRQATALSLEQQQKLCIARLLPLQPEVLLMDEPCSALDPVATAKIEELLFSLKQDLTVVIVTHNMQQAARVSDWTAFMYLGEIVEFGLTKQIFTTPSKKQTDDYITGRFG